MDELRFTYTEADYLKAVKLRMNHGHRRHLRKAIVVVSLLLALLMLRDWGVTVAVLVFAVPTLMVLLIYQVFLPWLVRKRIREMKPLREEVVLRVFEDRIEMESAAGLGKFTWFLNVYQDKQMLLLMVNQVSFVMVPRRVCVDDAQYERIAALGRRLAEKETT